jgi:dTDP-4-amino-4,6-dideoxygalactose transaminase
MADLPLTVPFEDGIGKHVYHQYTLLCDRRDEVMKALQENRIGCAIYYPVPLHRQNVFKDECAGVSLPVTEEVAAECLSLPICSELDEETIEKIVAVIRGVLKR